MTKHKKIKGRKRKKSGRSRTPAAHAAPKRKWVLIVGLIACVVLVSIFVRRLLIPASDTIEEKKPLSEPLPSTETASELTPEEETEALKKEEIELARQVLNEFPNSEDSLMLMGDLCARHGDSTEAVTYWEKSLERNPRRFDAWRNMGRIALEKEQFDQAVTCLRKALDIRPNTPELRSDIAKALMDSGRYAQAITELEKELDVFPASFTARFQLAEAYRQQKAYEKAVEHYERTIALEPEHSHAHYGMAMAYTRMGQRDKAREHLAVFRKLRKKVDSVYSERQVGSQEYLESLRGSVVTTYLDAERLYRNSGNTAKAEKLLKRACRLEPNNTRCLERLASLYYTTRRADKALQCFVKISRIDPNNPLSYLNIGKVATRLKRLDQAEQAFRKTIALAPSDAIGYHELARFYLRTNTNIAKARVLAQKAITLEKSAEAYFLLGWASDVNGDRDGALRAMVQAVQLQPDNPTYRKIYERIKNKK